MYVKIVWKNYRVFVERDSLPMGNNASTGEWGKRTPLDWYPLLDK
jgi:hypothetical protein